jgi:hypothetical protein
VLRPVAGAITQGAPKRSAQPAHLIPRRWNPLFLPNDDRHANSAFRRGDVCVADTASHHARRTSDRHQNLRAIWHGVDEFADLPECGSTTASAAKTGLNGIEANGGS